METATFTEFRKHAAHYFDAVQSGETICVMRHGKLIAKIIPIEPQEERKVVSWKKQALRLSIKGVKLSEAILNDRAHSKA